MIRIHPVDFFCYIRTCSSVGLERQFSTLQVSGSFPLKSIVNLFSLNQGIIMPTVKPPSVQAEIFALTLEKKFKESVNKPTLMGAAPVLKKTFSESIKFMLDAIAESMVYAQSLYVSGEDKKLFVLNVVRRLYDTVVGPALPYWLYPFNSAIKAFVVDQLISNFIDWAVLKFKNGSWGKL